jgi:3-dehydroquinate dehydratase-2
VRDAISGIDTPVYEIHISNIEAREEFRKSKTAAVCRAGCLFGSGVFGYEV